MTDSIAALRGAAVRILFAFLAAVLAGSCGSGAVSPQVNDPTTITIMPNTATLYSGLPTQFVLTGGTGQYIVTSSNQAAVQVTGTVPGGSLVVVPNYVVVDTPVTLTVRDTGAHAPVTATLTVKPNPVNNDVTITPSSSQAAGCSPTLCSGGDAIVSATISQGGVPLSARGVRMTVVSGDFRFIVSPPGQSEVLATSIDVVSDEVGKVSARIRALNDAPSQTALVEVMDLGTLAFRRASFVITQNSGANNNFLVTPTSVTFSGRFTGQCASSGNAVVFVFGGSPPYTIANTSGSAFVTSDNFLAQSGDSFSVSPTGTCSSGFPIVVRDSAGRTSTVTVSNLEGTTVPTDVAVSPDTVTISSCTDSASVTISGGTGSYFASSGSSAFIVSVSGPTATIRRRGTVASPTGPVPSPVLIGFSDGRTSATVTVQTAPPPGAPDFPPCP